MAAIPGQFPVLDDRTKKRIDVQLPGEGMFCDSWIRCFILFGLHMILITIMMIMMTTIDFFYLIHIRQVKSGLVQVYSLVLSWSQTKTQGSIVFLVSLNPKELRVSHCIISRRVRSWDFEWPT